MCIRHSYSNLRDKLAYLSVVAPIQCHSVLPEMFKEGGQDLCFNVIGFHTICGTALLHHLKMNRNKMHETKIF